MNIVFIGALVSISFAIISFIATSNFIVTGIVFAITILYFIIFANPFWNKYRINGKENKESHNSGWSNKENE